MDQRAIHMYLEERRIRIDYELQPVAWQAAADAFADYAVRIRRNRIQTSGRLLADFIIGAHALHSADRLMTMDSKRYRTSFPNLRLIEPAIIH